MVTVEFAASLQRHIPCPPQTVAAGSLAQVLGTALQAQQGLRSYVLDDQGHIRKHVAVFVNNDMHTQRQQLTRPVVAGDKVLVIQCLTGG
jgi:sulfur-carrier protein